MASSESPGLPSQASEGDERVLALDFPSGGEDNRLSQGFGKIQVIPPIGTRMGHTRRTVRAMREDTVRPPAVAVTVGNRIVKLLGFRLQLVSGQVG
jgi:hypothetical protein